MQESEAIFTSYNASYAHNSLIFKVNVLKFVVYRVGDLYKYLLCYRQHSYKVGELMQEMQLINR